MATTSGQLSLNLPSLEQLISIPRSKASWKNSSKMLLNIDHYIALTEECPADYPIGYCDLPLDKPSHHWSSTLHDQQATTGRTNFRVRMLVGCDGLEVSSQDEWHSPRRLKLCHIAPENPTHFILHCPSRGETYCKCLTGLENG